MLIKGNFFYICDKELKAVETLLELSKKKHYGFLTITKFITNMTKTERNSHRMGEKKRAFTVIPAYTRSTVKRR